MLIFFVKCIRYILILIRLAALNFYDIYISFVSTKESKQNLSFDSHWLSSMIKRLDGLQNLLSPCLRDGNSC